MLELIQPIITATYGDGSMPRALAQHLAEKVEADDWDSRGREYGIMLACWNWFAGGSTAASVAHQIEAALQEQESDA